jgi:hypothetical protein
MGPAFSYNRLMNDHEVRCLLRLLTVALTYDTVGEYMADLVVRLNLEAQDIEIVLGGKVVDTVGADIVSSWVNALNDKNGVGVAEPSNDTDSGPESGERDELVGSEPVQTGDTADVDSGGDNQPDAVLDESS